MTAEELWMELVRQHPRYATEGVSLTAKGMKKLVTGSFEHGAKTGFRKGYNLGSKNGVKIGVKIGRESVRPEYPAKDDFFGDVFKDLRPEK